MTTRTKKRSAAARAPKPRLARRIETWPIGDLRPYARNPRDHSNEQIALIAESIRQHGFVNPILAKEDGEVIAGHGRLEAARRMGLSQVPVVRLGHLTENQARALRVIDNKLSELSSWNTQMLVDELDELSRAGVLAEHLGFDAGDLERLERELADTVGSATLEADGTKATEAAEAASSSPKNPVARPGDVWLLGRHRLVIGDELADGVLRRASSLRRADCILDRWRTLVGREPVLEGGGKLSEERARRCSTN